MPTNQTIKNPAPKRGLKANEALCKFGCNTIIDKNDKADGEKGHCGMCCDEAIECRTKRVTPIHEAAKKAAIKKGEARAKAKADAALDKATKPAAK